MLYLCDIYFKRELVSHSQTLLCGTPRFRLRCAPLSLMPRDRGRRKSVTRRRRYTKDLLDRVIYQRYVLGLETTDISRNLDIPRRVVQRAIQTFDRTGEPCRTEKRTEYHSKLDAEDEDVSIPSQSWPCFHFERSFSQISSRNVPTSSWTRCATS